MAIPYPPQLDELAPRNRQGYLPLSYFQRPQLRIIPGLPNFKDLVVFFGFRAIVKLASETIQINCLTREYFATFDAKGIKWHILLGAILADHAVGCLSY